MPNKKYPLNTIYFYLTEGCNLCCRHCWIAPKYEAGDNSHPSLDLRLFESILDQAKLLGLSNVKLTGGEPLIHPEIYDILNLIRNRNLRLTIETNGILCTPKFAEEVVKSKNAFVAISLDAAEAKIHDWIRGKDGSFEKAKDGIRNLARTGLKPQIIMTIMRRNRGQIEPLIRLAEDLGAGSVKFNIVQPIARGEKMHEAEETLNIEELISIGEWIEKDLSAKTGLVLFYSHPLAFRPLGKIFGEKTEGRSVCSIFSILGVLANGNYALCGIGETVPELVFGDARKDRMEDVWNNAPVLKSLRNNFPDRLEGICGDCAMKNRCLGYCVAVNYYKNRSLFSECWYCAEARRKELFPKTRLKPCLV